MAIKLKHIVIGGLFVAAGVGFYIVSTKTKGTDDTDDDTVDVGGTDYRVQIIPHREGGYAGVVVVDGQPQDSVIGPMPTVDELEIQIANYMAGLDVPAFYTVRVDDTGAYFFDGWSRGSKATSNGPYASEQLANEAGSSWARAALVPVPTI